MSYPVCFGRGDDTVGNPHRAQIYQFELSELILLLRLDKQFPFEQSEATVSQSTVPSPLLNVGHHRLRASCHEATAQAYTYYYILLHTIIYDYVLCYYYHWYYYYCVYIYIYIYIYTYMRRKEIETPLGYGHLSWECRQCAENRNELPTYYYYYYYYCVYIDLYASRHGDRDASRLHRGSVVSARKIEVSFPHAGFRHHLQFGP